MKTVFVDTSAFYAALDSSDAKHEDAKSLFGKAADERWNLITTNFVVAETHALILTKLSRHAAAEWLRRVPAKIKRVKEEDEEKGKEIIFKYQDKDFSYCDATSFALMERLGINQAMAFDRHFQQYGRFAILKELIAPL